MEMDNNFQEHRYLEEHHILYGSGRRELSEAYGLKVNLCLKHHRDSPVAVHSSRRSREVLCQIGQRAFENKYPDKDFRGIFGKNYL